MKTIFTDEFVDVITENIKCVKCTSCSIEKKECMEKSMEDREKCTSNRILIDLSSKIIDLDEVTGKVAKGISSVDSLCIKRKKDKITCYLIEFKSGLWNFKNNSECVDLSEEVKKFEKNEKLIIKSNKIIDKYSENKIENMILELKKKILDTAFILLPRIIKKELLGILSIQYIIVMSDERKWKPHTKLVNGHREIMENKAYNGHIDKVNKSLAQYRTNKVFSQIDVLNSSEFPEKKEPLIKKCSEILVVSP